MLTTKQRLWLQNRKSQKLELNAKYLVQHSTWTKAKPAILQLVKVTPKGFNLLNTETGKCVLYPHIYPWKKTLKTYDDPMHFWVSNSWIFLKITSYNEKEVEDFMNTNTNTELATYSYKK